MLSNTRKNVTDTYAFTPEIENGTAVQPHGARPVESAAARLVRYKAEADLALAHWQFLERLLENNKLRDGDGLPPEEIKRLSGKASKARATYWWRRQKIVQLRTQAGPGAEIISSDGFEKQEGNMETSP